MLLTEWLLASEGTNLVWRLNPYDPLALRAAQICGVAGKRDFTHSIRLDADPDTLFKGFKKGTREDIRKAHKRGNIEVRPATSAEEWRALIASDAGRNHLGCGDLGGALRRYIDSLREWPWNRRQWSVTLRLFMKWCWQSGRNVLRPDRTPS